MESLKSLQNRLQEIKLSFYVADDMRDNIISQLNYQYERLKKLHKDKDSLKEAIKKSRIIKKLQKDLIDLKDAMKSAALYSKSTKQLIKYTQRQK